MVSISRVMRGSLPRPRESRELHAARLPATHPEQTFEVNACRGGRERIQAIRGVNIRGDFSPRGCLGEERQNDARSA